jgi:hypothetical protein
VTTPDTQRLIPENRNKNAWELPEFKTSLYYNQRLAKKLSGKYALIGIVHLAKNGKVKSREQHHGIIFQVHPKDGVDIWENGTTRIYTLPPDLRPWRPAKKGTYTIRTTGEEISNVDYISRWIMPYGSTQPIPMHGSSYRTNSSASNIYGIGTKLYGHSDKLKDGSFTVTKWITIFLFPVLPVGSFRILSRDTSLSFGYGLRGKHTSEPVFTDAQQVLKAYAISIPSLTFFIFVVIRILLP